jgi:hypothetical protein
MNILSELHLQSFWELSAPPLEEYLRPFQHQLHHWVLRKFSSFEFFDGTACCEDPMHRWPFHHVAQFFMNAGYLTFCANAEPHVQLELPNRSIGESFAAAIEKVFQLSALQQQTEFGLLAYRHIRAGRVKEAYLEYSKMFRALALEPSKVRFALLVLASLCFCFAIELGSG